MDNGAHGGGRRASGRAASISFRGGGSTGPSTSRHPHPRWRIGRTSSTRSVGRIDDVSVQTASEGNPIPKVYGRMRLAGTVIWATDFEMERVANFGTAQATGMTLGAPLNGTFALNPTDESGKAAMNAYIESNVVRDFTLARNPSYPTIGNQFDWDTGELRPASCVRAGIG